jgi:hypothetical protein
MLDLQHISAGLADGVVQVLRLQLCASFLTLSRTPPSACTISKPA